MTPDPCFPPTIATKVMSESDLVERARAYFASRGYEIPESVPGNVVFRARNPDDPMLDCRHDVWTVWFVLSTGVEGDVAAVIIRCDDLSITPAYRC